MADSAIKTKATDAKVAEFVAAIDNDTRRTDAETLLSLYAEITGEPATMWGPSIIGYGSYHYKYDSGREGDMCRGGFSPRKANLSVYLMCGYADPEMAGKIADLRNRLGKHKMGASCLYIGKLADVDGAVLREMIATDWAWMNAKYPH